MKKEYTVKDFCSDADIDFPKTMLTLEKACLRDYQQTDNYGEIKYMDFRKLWFYELLHFLFNDILQTYE